MAISHCGFLLSEVAHVFDYKLICVSVCSLLLFSTDLRNGAWAGASYKCSTLNSNPLTSVCFLEHIQMWVSKNRQFIILRC